MQLFVPHPHPEDRVIFAFAPTGSGDLSDAESGPPPRNIALGKRPCAPTGSRRPLRILLLGSRPDVTETIKNLHRRGFAQAREWSAPMPCPNSGELLSRLLPNLHPDEVISILTKYLNQG